MEKVYTFLSASTNRWDILKAHLSSTDLVPKAICTTRWSSRIDAIKPLRHHLKQIISALKEISQSSKFESTVRAEAAGVIKLIDFQFLCGLCVWYDLLGQINLASKSLQSITSNVETALIVLSSVKKFIEDYSSHGFEKMINDATVLANDINVDVGFATQKRKRSLGSVTTASNFEEKFFDFLLEVTTNAINERFEAINELNKQFFFSMISQTLMKM